MKRAAAKPAHTPGPWTVLRADFDDSGNARYTLDGIKTIGALDARLIAAASELLSALIYLRDCIETGKEPGMGIVHAAIKKAGGNP